MFDQRDHRSEEWGTSSEQIVRASIEVEQVLDIFVLEPCSLGWVERDGDVRADGV